MEMLTKFTDVTVKCSLNLNAIQDWHFSENVHCAYRYSFSGIIGLLMGNYFFLNHNDGELLLASSLWIFRFYAVFLRSWRSTTSYPL